MWQKRARFGVAVLFVASAIAVYLAIGRRPPQVAPADVKRIDPAATQESSGCKVMRFRGESRDFELTCETQLGYADGTVRMLNVTIRVRKDNGRSYIVTAGEARSEQDQNHLQLSSGVALAASDGFRLMADRASYSKTQGVIHSDVEVSFSKGRMSGSGTSVDFNENSDVLTIGQQAKVVTVDTAGMTTLDFAAGTAVLDRLQDLLTLDGGVHVLREQQVMDADHALARLSPGEEFITFIELRGNARVHGGGGALDTMSARDIDLDYSDDGVRLERVALVGTAAVTLAAAGGAAGRQFTGESLDVLLAPDGTVTAAVGRENVRMLLPASPAAPARSVRGRTLDATGVPGQGLTSARFADAVEYLEEGTRTTPQRVVRSQKLDLGLTGDAVTAATFTGAVTFEEPSFRAQAGIARYDPSAGTLNLTESDARGLPCIADDQIAVDAETIDIAVESRRLQAHRRVKATIRPGGASRNVGNSACAVARQRTSRDPASRSADSDNRLPGLFKQDQIATGSADALEYAGTGKGLVFSGNASLLQEPTMIRGSVIRIDQERGDLVVTGNARVVTAQGSGESREHLDGRAEEIRYVDADRMISYLNAPESAAKPAGNKTVQVNSPQMNLLASRVDVILDKDGRAERLEAYRNITARIDKNTATADRLTYRAATEQYDMEGAGGLPVRINDGCVETSGKTLTYFKAEGRTEVKGNDEMRTQSKSAGCREPAGTRR